MLKLSDAKLEALRTRQRLTPAFKIYMEAFRTEARWRDKLAKRLKKHCGIDTDSEVYHLFELEMWMWLESVNDIRALQDAKQIADMKKANAAMYRDMKQYEREHEANEAAKAEEEKKSSGLRRLRNLKRK